MGILLLLLLLLVGSGTFGNFIFTGKCKKCESGDGYQIIIFLLILVVFTPMTYYLVNSKLTARMSTVTVVCVGFGSLITMVQMTTVLSRLSVNWPVQIGFVWGAFAFVALDVRFMKPSCVFGSQYTAFFFGISTNYLINFI